MKAVRSFSFFLVLLCTCTIPLNPVWALERRINLSHFLAEYFSFVFLYFALFAF